MIPFSAGPTEGYEKFLARLEKCRPDALSRGRALLKRLPFSLFINILHVHVYCEDSENESSLRIVPCL